jgi:hypothetical protein
MAGVGLMLSVSRISAQPQAPERRQVREVLEQGAPEEEKAPSKAEVKRELKQQRAEEKAIEQARRARQKMRQTELTRVKDRLEQRKQTGALPPPTNALDNISAKELAVTPEPNAAPVQPVNPTVPPSPEEGTEIDENSNLSGGNRRGRISRISCR